jgi:hypothetical protein
MFGFGGARVSPRRREGTFYRRVSLFWHPHDWILYSLVVSE